MATAKTENRHFSLSSGWASFLAQVIALIFWAAWFTFIAQSNTKRLDKFLDQDLPTRVKVAETRLEYYDTVFVEGMKEIQGQIVELKLEIRELQNHESNRTRR